MTIAEKKLIKWKVLNKRIVCRINRRETTALFRNLDDVCKAFPALTTCPKFMKKSRVHSSKNSIFYILEIIFSNYWIFLGIVGGIFAFKLINTPEGVIFGVIFGIIIGHILFRGN